MKKLIGAASLAAMCLMALPGCSGKAEAAQDQLPADFNSLDDAAKVAYMMNNVEPDSVARFICDAALGRERLGMRIDTLAMAAAYAYEHYNDSSLIVFSREFDTYSANLPLEDKMRIYVMAGESDPNRLGYQLGLEYVSHIRDNKMTAEDVRREIEAFRSACANDSDTYVRFMKGFKTVLRTDHGKDLPENIYNSFIDY
jgi:hypothetical protein